MMVLSSKIYIFGVLVTCHNATNKSVVAIQLKAYPALVDEKNSVGIKLFETETEQQAAMWQGIRRLLLLNIPSPIKYFA